MTEPTSYQFRGERLEAALVDAARRMYIGDLEGIFDIVPDAEKGWDDGSEFALVLTESTAAHFANRIVSGDFGPDPRHGAWHTERLQRLNDHVECDTAIEELIAQRDDVIASIVSARDYCFNDVSLSEYGELHVDAEELLDCLRPSLRSSGTYRSPDLVGDRCPQCESSGFYHEDWCTIYDDQEALISRRRDAIATHLHCIAMALAIINHTARCITRVEEIAHRARLVTTERDGHAVVNPRAVLKSIRLEDLNPPNEPPTATTLATAIEPPLRDLNYCQQDEPFHTEPHRACRYLIS